MKRKNLLCGLFLAAALIFATSCEKTEKDLKPEELMSGPDHANNYSRHRLKSYSLIGIYPKESLPERYTGTPYTTIPFKYDIKVYRIAYTTKDVEGNPITASGAVIVPDVNKHLPLMSVQHGVLTDKSRAPSLYGTTSAAWVEGSIFASLGYVVSVPDYLGYGESEEYPHPYEHRRSLASASLDMLRAAKEFCEEKKICLNGKNFLAGYSEGGYATMSLHQLIEEHYSKEFKITASSPGGGAYDKYGFSRYILTSNQEFIFLNYYAWVLSTYNKVYGINRPLSYYFTEPNATKLTNNLFDPTIDRNPQILFKKSFIESILCKTDTKFIRALRDNNNYDWKPDAPVLLVHRDADDFVPKFNSVKAYKAMTARGAKSVSLVFVPGADHFSTIPTWLLNSIAFFDKYR